MGLPMRAVIMRGDLAHSGQVVMTTEREGGGRGASLLKERERERARARRSVVVLRTREGKGGARARARCRVVVLRTREGEGKGKGKGKGKGVLSRCHRPEEKGGPRAQARRRVDEGGRGQGQGRGHGCIVVLRTREGGGEGDSAGAYEGGARAGTSLRRRRPEDEGEGECEGGARAQARTLSRCRARRCPEDEGGRGRRGRRGRMSRHRCLVDEGGRGWSEGAGTSPRRHRPKDEGEGEGEGGSPLSECWGAPEMDLGGEISRGMVLQTNFPCTESEKSAAKGVRSGGSDAWHGMSRPIRHVDQMILMPIASSRPSSFKLQVLLGRLCHLATHSEHDAISCCVPPTHSPGWILDPSQISLIAAAWGGYNCVRAFEAVFSNSVSGLLDGVGKTIRYEQSCAREQVNEHKLLAEEGLLPIQVGPYDTEVVINGSSFSERPIGLSRAIPMPQYLTPTLQTTLPCLNHIPNAIATPKTFRVTDSWVPDVLGRHHNSIVFCGWPDWSSSFKIRSHIAHSVYLSTCRDSGQPESHIPGMDGGLIQVDDARGSQVRVGFTSNAQSRWYKDRRFVLAHDGWKFANGSLNGSRCAFDAPPKKTSCSYVVQQEWMKTMARIMFSYEMAGQGETSWIQGRNRCIKVSSASASGGAVYNVPA
ncbi:hypothetical protein OG21DRAFT_1527334 [Imleria badia]|nr:hypothetical protein OG21DRAFT_1527334 [Imleria badia]